MYLKVFNVTVQSSENDRGAALTEKLNDLKAQYPHYPKLMSITPHPPTMNSLGQFAQLFTIILYAEMPQ